MIFNKKRLKQEFKDKGIKISNEVLSEFIDIKSKEIEFDIEKIIRVAKISGRKIVRNEDINKVK